MMHCAPNIVIDAGESGIGLDIEGLRLGLDVEGLHLLLFNLVDDLEEQSLERLSCMFAAWPCMATRTQRFNQHDDPDGPLYPPPSS